MKEEADQEQLEKVMKILTEKIQKIRNVKYGERLDPSSLKLVLSLLDTKDPQFKPILEFLESERRSYLETVLRKEEERSKFSKSKKGKSQMNMTSSL